MSRTPTAEAPEVPEVQPMPEAPDPPKPRRFRVLYGAVTGVGIDAKGTRIHKDFYHGAVVTEADLGGMAGHYLASGDGTTPMISELEV